MKRTKKLFAVMMTLALMLVFIPSTAMAVDDSDSSGVVIVTVSNTTFDEGDWTGELFTEYVDLTPGMTMGEAVQAACEAAGVSVTGATTGYITDIEGLSSGDAGGWSGWMFTVDNWFNTTGLSAPAEDGDWISVQYSVDGMGADLGSIFTPVEDANNKTLQQLEFDEGTLSPEFSADVHKYTLTVPADTSELFVLPIAFNLNYQVRTSVDGTVYKLMNGVPIEDGTVITITCGDPEWPSMNNGDYGTGAELVPGETYEITVAMEEAVVDDPDTDTDTKDISAETAMDKSPKTGDADMVFPLILLITLGGVGMATVARRRTN